MSKVRVISVFNNKGGVGKTTLTYHLGHALAELGKKTLLVDLDPQCNLTIYGIEMEAIHQMWLKEDSFIEGFDAARMRMADVDFAALNSEPRTAHYMLMPAAEGTGELASLPPPFRLATNLDILPGRLTLHLYEDKVASRWSDLYRGDPLAIRTVTRIRGLVEQLAKLHGYDVAIIDTSPSLGSLNKVIISTVDSFLIPCLPDVFSLYGIRNIGNALADWTGQFKVVHSLLSDEKRRSFPTSPVKFLGFTVYNARKYSGPNPWNLAQAHYNYATKIPETIKDYIPKDVRSAISDTVIEQPIGGTSVMHSHNTLPSMAHKYKCPIWKIPSCGKLEPEDKPTVMGNRSTYEATRDAYLKFATAVIDRMSMVEAA